MSNDEYRTAEVRMGNNAESRNLDLAVKLHRSGRLEEAEAVYRRVLLEQPNNPDVLHLLGVIAYQRKQYDEAIELLSRAISLRNHVPEYRNSTLEALSCNLPIVTMPGHLMRGRHTHAILKMMGLEELEAHNLEEYVAFAAGLAQDPLRRKNCSEKISLLKHRAYRDTECIRGLEQFLKNAVHSY
jgi:tetratricopeptide (TPR) repeat protein